MLEWRAKRWRWVGIFRTLQRTNSLAYPPDRVSINTLTNQHSTKKFRAVPGLSAISSTSPRLPPPSLGITEEDEMTTRTDNDEDLSAVPSASAHTPPSHARLPRSASTNTDNAARLSSVPSSSSQISRLVLTLQERSEFDFTGLLKRTSTLCC